MSGHNDAVFDVDFHPGGEILASASGDTTVKLWDVATGRRLDTLGQPNKEQYAVAFSPNGQLVVAGGVDNRIRVWRISGEWQGRIESTSACAVRSQKADRGLSIFTQWTCTRFGSRRPNG